MHHHVKSAITICLQFICLVLSFQIIGSPPGRSIAPMGWGARGVGNYGAAVVGAPDARPARWALKESVVVAATTWAGRAFQSLMDLWVIKFSRVFVRALGILSLWGWFARVRESALVRSRVSAVTATCPLMTLKSRASRRSLRRSSRSRQPYALSHNKAVLSNNVYDI